MKRYFTAIIPSLLLCGSVFSSCNMISYPGEYKTDGFYESARQAYFDFGKESKDTVAYVSFSLRPLQEAEAVVEVPIHMVGTPSDHPVSIGVGIVADKTSAKEGVQYEIMDKTVTFPKDSLKTVLRVKLFRAGVGEKAEDRKEIVLKLVGTEDLKVAFPDKNEFKIRFDNYLDTSDWELQWNSYYSPMLGTFNRTVFLKLLEFYNFDAEALQKDFWQPTMLSYWAQTKQFFEDHPEYGIEVFFPDFLKLYTDF